MEATNGGMSGVVLSADEIKTDKFKAEYRAAGRWFLYRLYDESGDLLYVGTTNSWSNRLLSHKHRAFWPLVSKVAIITYANKQKALIDEKASISSDKPRYNRTYHDNSSRYHTKHIRTIMDRN